MHDTNLSDLSGLHYLESLYLNGTSITGAGLKYLNGVDTGHIRVASRP